MFQKLTKRVSFSQQINQTYLNIAIEQQLKLSFQDKIKQNKHVKPIKQRSLNLFQQSHFNNEELSTPQCESGNFNVIYPQKQFNDSITNKLQQQIIQQTIILPKQLGTKQLNFPILQASQNNNKKSTQNLHSSSLEQQNLVSINNQKQTLNNLSLQKQQILNKMHNIQQQQLQLKCSLNSSQNKVDPQRIMYKSELTEEDRKKLKQLIKNTRNYQKTLQNKNKQIREMEFQKSLEEIRYAQQLNKAKKQQRKSMILSNIKSMELKSENRKKSLEISRKKIEDINSKRYLYEQNMDKQRIIEVQKAREYERILQECKQRAKLDTRDIQEHQKKYEKNLEEMRSKSSRVLKNESNQYVRSLEENYYRNRTKMLLQQQKIEELARLKKGHNMKQKIAKFQEEVNSKHKPKVSQESKFQLPKSTVTSAKVLSNVDQRLKGVQYLQIAKKLKDIQKEKERRRTHAVPITKLQYIDYSKELKYNQSQTAEHQFKGIIRNGRSMSDYETASKALLLAEQIQAKSKKTKDDKLVNSVKHKMQILKALE